MKLSELKGALIEQFFKTREGVNEEKVSDVILSLGAVLQEDASSFPEVDESSRSHEPSKAFSKFISGRRSVLLIEDESEAYKRTVIFAAMRFGKKIAAINLTEETDPKLGSLAQVKQALYQAKAMNDDACFSIIYKDD